MNGKLSVSAAVAALLLGAVALRAQQPADVAQLYARNCASCHGAAGTPNPAMVSAMGPILDFADSRAMAARPDSALVVAVTAGKGRNMPAYRTRLTAEQIRALVAHIRTFTRRP